MARRARRRLWSMPRFQIMGMFRVPGENKEERGTISPIAPCVGLGTLGRPSAGISGESSIHPVLGAEELTELLRTCDLGKVHRAVAASPLMPASMQLLHPCWSCGQDTSDER